MKASGRQRALGPQWSTVEQLQLRWERSAAMVRTWVKITVRPCLHLPLTHTKHHPFENKVWEIYFYKEVYSFVHWSSYIVLDYVSAYIFITAIQQTLLLSVCTSKCASIYGLIYLWLDAFFFFRILDYFICIYCFILFMS